MIDARKPVVDRMSGGALRIRWDNANSDQPVRVYAGTDPDAIERTDAVGNLENGELIFPDPDPGTRRFFELVSADPSQSRIIAERKLPFDGAHNFRDLGGYATRDGRHVRWGKVFRADHLAELTDADLGYMEQLGIRLVCDFRGKEEVAEKPNRLPSTNPPIQINPDILGTAMMPGEIQAAIMNGNPDGLDFSQLLIDGNRSMVTKSLEQYRELFRRLSSEETVPLLFHCTAGKDRTGVGAALILLALGVPEETVMWDYLLTEFYTKDRVEQMIANTRASTPEFAKANIDFEAVRPIMSVRREFLQAAFDGIHEEYGNVDRYMEEAMQLSKTMRESLCERLLR